MPPHELIPDCAARFAQLEGRINKHSGELKEGIGSIKHLENIICGDGSIENGGLVAVAKRNKVIIDDLVKAKGDVDVKKWAVIIIILQAIFAFLTSIGTAIAVSRLVPHP
jgi:hypothetical protein